MSKGAAQAVAAIVPLALLLGACDTTREALKARIEISTPTCATAPDLNGATAFAAPKDKDGVLTATIRFGDAAPCLADAAGRKSAYAVLALPPSDQPMIVTVTSYAMGQTILSPRLELRDEKGAPTRTVGREAFMFSGTSLQTQLRQRPGERYLVIVSDSATVGQNVEQIQSIRNTTGVMAGGIYVPINTGAEAKAQLVFAHNGEVTTTVAPRPTADTK